MRICPSLMGISLHIGHNAETWGIFLLLIMKAILPSFRQSRIMCHLESRNICFSSTDNLITVLLSFVFLYRHERTLFAWGPMTHTIPCLCSWPPKQWKKKLPANSTSVWCAWIFHTWNQEVWYQVQGPFRNHLYLSYTINV